MKFDQKIERSERIHERTSRQMRHYAPYRWKNSITKIRNGVQPQKNTESQKMGYGEQSPFHFNILDFSVSFCG